MPVHGKAVKKTPPFGAKADDIAAAYRSDPAANTGLSSRKARAAFDDAKIGQVANMKIARIQIMEETT